MGLEVFLSMFRVGRRQTIRVPNSRVNFSHESQFATSDAKGNSNLEYGVLSLITVLQVSMTEMTGFFLVFKVEIGK